MCVCIEKGTDYISDRSHLFITAIELKRKGGNHSFHNPNITLFHMIQGQSAARSGLFVSRSGAGLFIPIRKIKPLLSYGCCQGEEKRAAC